MEHVELGENVPVEPLEENVIVPNDEDPDVEYPVTSAPQVAGTPGRTPPGGEQFTLVEVIASPGI
jgi:hypothetical protein